MTLAIWLRIIISLIGLAAFGALVWFASPLISVAGIYPFDSEWVRFAIIAVVSLIVLGLLVWGIIRRRREAAALEQGLADAAVDEGDGDVLGERMADALLTLKKSAGSSATYLYELPWYVLIGPPGSGKTTALVNSGLKFPLAKGGAPSAVAGVGGTRYCDWWFTDDAVLIDTAGRYTTQDSDASADRKSWLAFLDLLKKNRPNQPINGVMLAISIEDVLTASPAELNAHSDAIRARLTELHDNLKVDFPVYALFTKMDLVSGFMEYFQHLNEASRRVVWGHTFQTDDKTLNMISEVPDEFDALVERLNSELPDRLQEEPTPNARVQIFGFPTQMAAVKTPIIEFLNRIFEPTRYHSRATLRGFYFTSGTQQGTPIDQLIGAMARNFGANQVAAAAMSGSGKSFFLTDLITKVVIGESAWVSTDRRAVRRAFALKAAAYSVLALVTLGGAAAWWTSYNRNVNLIAETNDQSKTFVATAAPIIQEPTVADRDLEKVVPLLDALRALPAGYAQEGVSPPVQATFGLSQWDRLGSSSQAAYKTGLERLLRSRLIFRMEELIEANRSRPDFIYEALKVYLILGGRQKMDEDLILLWMRRDWVENLYQGAANARLREELSQHLTAMLRLPDSGGAGTLTLNEPLIEEAQKTLARLSLAERAYQLLRVQARASPGKPDWTAAAKGGADAKLVFEGPRGGELENVRVPFFYTYAGFHEGFIGRLRDVAKQIEEERWVLGTAGDQTAVSDQYEALPRALLELYAKDFIASWQGTMAALRFRPLLANKPQYPALSAASAVTSPLKQVLESIRDETKLTRERPAPAGQAATQSAAGSLSQAQQAQNLAQRLGVNTGSASTTLSRMDIALKAMEKPNTASGEQAPGATIEAAFKPFHQLFEGEQGRRPIDQVLLAFSEVNQNLRLLATNPALAPQVNATLPGQIQTLRNSANLIPQPFSNLIQTAATSFENELTGSSVSQLLQDLRSQVTATCNLIVTNRYPFARGSDRDVPLADFGRLFGTGGIMDKFYTTNLAPLVDTSKPEWAFKQNISVARSLPPAALKEFQRAADIKDAFFGTGGNMPSFTMAITPQPAASSGSAPTIKLDISGVAVVAQAGGGPTPVVWPGPAGLDRTVISSQTTSTGLFGGVTSSPPVFGPEKRGPWAFFRFLDLGSVTKRGEALVASYSVGGQSISYQINVSSLKNPLTLPALREFRCPGG
ncbi:type VI secretion system protein ImpL [Bosea sp. BE125]|uniref:type VI secretion system membrane subunit TssM n=1 Tax=Bosea sp. BE125 TaxID=2817909 RepID=UPI00285D486F|nr:type VI secretion system membrane subunit TssM [Bosea sp. BE125]MDR6871061.1 type VI secretion system protein ImpL [Bosea sp. BE125]